MTRKKARASQGIVYVQLLGYIEQVDSWSANMKLGRLGISTERTDNPIEAIDVRVSFKSWMSRNMPLPESDVIQIHG